MTSFVANLRSTVPDPIDSLDETTRI